MKTDNPDSALALDSQLCFALYAANRAVTKLYRPLLEELELTYPQYLVMLVLWESAGLDEAVSVSSLGKRLRLDSGTLTPLLKRMETHGLLVRERLATDERVVQVRLTGQGADLRQRARRVPVEVLCRSGMSLDETASLRDALRAMLDRLEAPE
ncbi:MarR family transcriptional regulator [Marinobacteraceae bacterium S3BR75-40.1]